MRAFAQTQSKTSYFRAGRGQRRTELCVWMTLYMNLFSFFPDVYVRMSAERKKPKQVYDFAGCPTITRGKRQKRSENGKTA